MTHHFIGGLILLTLCGACLDPTKDEADLQAPTITAAATTNAIAPPHFSDVSEDADRIPLSFAVSDEEGLSEIVLDFHNGFDGHVHGRSLGNNDFILFRYRHTITQDELTDPFRFESQADDEITSYLDDRNPLIPTDVMVLAGPYHFSIRAVDANGNETSYDDNSTYHTTVNLQRHYAPRVDFGSIDRTAGTVSGTVRRNQEHGASSDIVFLWVAVMTPDPDNPASEGDLKAEWLWGQSNWPHQFRPDGGDPLPDATSIDLANFLQEEEAIRNMNASDRLRVWAEDANGNITVRNFQ